MCVPCRALGVLRRQRSSVCLKVMACQTGSETSQAMKQSNAKCKIIISTTRIYINIFILAFICSFLSCTPTPKHACAHACTERTWRKLDIDIALRKHTDHDGNDDDDLSLSSVVSRLSIKLQRDLRDFCLAGNGPQSRREYNNISLDCIYIYIVDTSACTFFLARVSWRLAGPTAKIKPGSRLSSLRPAKSCSDSFRRSPFHLPHPCPPPPFTLPPPLPSELTYRLVTTATHTHTHTHTHSLSLTRAHSHLHSHTHYITLYDIQSKGTACSKPSLRNTQSILLHRAAMMHSAVWMPVRLSSSVPTTRQTCPHATLQPRC